jgi:hypothetical protein
VNRPQAEIVPGCDDWSFVPINVLTRPAARAVSPVKPDFPDEADESPDGNADRRDDQDDGGQANRPGNAEAETRNREEYYTDLRTAVSTEESTTVQRITAEEKAAAKKWDKQTEESRWMWTEYQRRWPPSEHTPVDRATDSSAAWVGNRNRSLDSADNSRVEAACDRIADRERERITPAMRALESQDPDRHLIGFEDCLKGRDRIKEKVFDKMKEFADFSPEEAIASISDTIRYTFEYHEARYTQGVWADIGHLKEQGFELHKLWNAWSDDKYKGANSKWIEPDTGQRFEVQFHTRISYEAKQLTHDAYEKLRTHQADKFEQIVLEAFEKKVAAEVPVPPGAADIPDYP